MHTSMNSDRASGYSILIPWCNRDEISLTLKQNAPWLSVHQAEVLVVNCGGDSGRLSELLRPSPIDYLRRIDIPAATFNKALALNVGLHLSQRDKVFVLDADILLQSDLLTEFDRIVDASTFATVKRVYESVPQVPDLLANIADKMAGSFLADISYTMTVELSFA